MLSLGSIQGFKDVVREACLRESPLVGVEQRSKMQSEGLKKIRDMVSKAQRAFFISINENQLVIKVPDKTAPDKIAPDEIAPDEIAPDETAPDETAPDETSPSPVYCSFICPEKMNDILEYHKFGVRLVAEISNVDVDNGIVLTDIYAFFHYLDCRNSLVITESAVQQRIKSVYRDSSELFVLPRKTVMKGPQLPEQNDNSKHVSEESDFSGFFSFNHDDSDRIDPEHQMFGIFGGCAVGDRSAPKNASNASSAGGIQIDNFSLQDQERNFGHYFTVIISDLEYFVYSLPYDADFNYVDKYEEIQKKQKAAQEKNRIKNHQERNGRNQPNNAIKAKDSEVSENGLPNDAIDSDISEKIQDDDTNYEIPSFILEQSRPQKELKAFISNTHRAFTVVSSGLKIPLFYKSYDEDTELLTAKTAIFRTGDNSPRFGIARGLLFFVSRNNFEKLQQRLVLNKSSAILRRMMDNKESYLGNWELYSHYEFRNEISRWQQFGLVRITSVNDIPGGYRLFMSKGFLKSKSHIRAGDEVAVIEREKAQEIISLGRTCSANGNSALQISSTESGDIVFSIADYESEEVARLCKLIYPEKGKNKSILQVMHFDGNAIDVTNDDLGHQPRVGDFLTLSSSGSAKAFKRRTAVLEKIKNEDCEMPHLKLLIENSDDIDLQLNRITKSGRNRILAPLSKRIQNKIFSRNPPTATQIEAISIALNTPDIALIQGPPGTGKTTVITAIIERLNEEFAEKEIKGQILVSGFQHDAVENIIQRLSINSLPSFKFGSKRGANNYSSNQTFHRIELWAENTAAKLRQKHVTVTASEEERGFDELAMEYGIFPSSENEEKILKWIINSGNTAVYKSKERLTAQILHKKMRLGDCENISLLRSVNRLRTKKSSFEDDGVSCCLSLISENDGRNFLSDKDRELLTEAASVSEQNLTEYLNKLESLKHRLLNLLLPTPEFHSPKPKKQIIELIQGVGQLIRQSHRDPDNLESNVVLDFISDLESNPYSVRKTIEEYQLVYAATTQQSLGDDIKNAKYKDSDEHHGDVLPSYDTVIIDEAARANPSDLLIPMSQARRRIILVGDHRQLPHMVEEEVLQAISREQQIDNDDIYKTSMFEYLFHRLQKLTAIDGIRRTITLDSQYRTHPFLGNFVSSYFYKLHDPTEAFDSPLPESLFQQNLKWIAGKCCTWFNVPNKYGAMEKNTEGSSYRTSEASVCAGLIKHWIDSEEGKNFSYGVITFYSAQRDEILKEMAEQGLATKTEDQNFDILDRYKYFPNGKERLRVGSVDAFQGMEFDIVLLSVVRTQDYKELDRIAANYDPDIASRKAAGFLAVENRLCVSMSRQKRFLGIVGDGEFFNHPLCARAIPSLSALFKYCSLQKNCTSMIPIGS